MHWVSTFEIPDKHTFSGSVQKSLDTGVICSKARRDIIQILRTLILQFTRYPKPEEYNTVSMKLIEKYPTLHDGDSESGYVSKYFVCGYDVCVYVCTCVCVWGGGGGGVENVGVIL